LSHVKIFLSTVSAEFRCYREALRHSLDRPNLTVKVQEDFIATGTETLIKLDDYIRECDAVVHLVGDMSGASALAPSVTAIRDRYPDFATRLPMVEPYLKPDGPLMTYTQWEAWLALYHNRVLIIATPKDDAPRDEDFQLIVSQQEAQQAHLALLKEHERYPEISFSSANNLSSELWRSTLHDVVPQLQPPRVVMECVRKMASVLLDVGRDTWKMPRFVAPLNLNAHEEKADSEPCTTSIADLTEAVCIGESVVLFGEGGIGKTTFLLELSGVLIDEKCPRIPLYIDAAYWAGTNTSILDYIISSTAAQQHEVTTNELVRLLGDRCLTLMVNGWNEISSTEKRVCLGRFKDLTTTTPNLNIVVVSRSLTDAPSLKSAKQIHVRGLSWQGQTEVIRSELDEGKATELIELLARETRLRHSARSPLILKGVIASAEKGQTALSSIFDLLGASVDAFEEDEQRQLSLEEPPVRNQHGHFLEALAYHLTTKQKTTFSHQEVLPVFSDIVKQLMDAGVYVYGSLPDPSDILTVLSNHHLLHDDGQFVRFSHQRFQEYFNAKQLLDICISGDDGNISLLSEAINQPFWEDALRLIAGKLKGVDGYASARSLLVRTALEVDLGFACDLAGVCAFSEADDNDLFHDMVSHINMLCDSPLHEVADYGLVCLIVSRFTVLSDRLWSLLESDDQQTRLGDYRLSNEGISLKQLGESAERRISAWLPERRIELMHELAENPDNYDFIVKAANEVVEDEVRISAIAALAWNFPASESAVQAWLKASPTVQLAGEVTHVIEDALKYGVAADEVRERLKHLILENATEEAKLRLAQALPDEVGEYAVEAILAELPEINHQRYAETMVELAMKHNPDKLKVLARKLVLSKRVVPDWASKVVQEDSVESRAEVFEDAWFILNGEGAEHLSAKVIGPLANRVQILRSVREWLTYQFHRRNLSEAERSRVIQLGYLLANASGDDLLSVVLEIGEGSSYPEVSELLGLILTRTRSYDGGISETTEWLPSSEEVSILIDAFGKLFDGAVVPQHKVHTLLCSIASRVAPSEFGDLLIEGCNLHLSAWEVYSSALNEWIKHPNENRPSNPYLSNYLISAMENWGFGALPSLLELLGHPQANQLIPQAIGRIVSQPWASKEKGPFQFNRVDFIAGEERRLVGRVLLQPDDTHQEMTDVAAKALGIRLTELVDQLRSEKATGSEKWNDKNAAFRMRVLLNIVSSTPSLEIVEPLMYALVNGFIDVYSAVNALKGLVSQGVFIDDSAVVARMEALYTEEAGKEWLDDQVKRELSEVCQLMYFVRPVSLLNKSLSEYLVEWQHYAYSNEIIRCLERIHSKDSWSSLLELGRKLAMEGKVPEHLIDALSATLNPDCFTEFINLITDGSWFAWSRSAWDLKRIAHDILSVIDDDSTRLEAFLDACEHSDSPMADVFACEVLELIPEGDPIRLRYSLAALDAGRATDSHSPVYSMMKSMFTLNVPLNNDGQYEIYQKSCNDLRAHIYIRAKGKGIDGSVCRRLLADIECMRRKDDRPSDEPRSPVAGDDVAWTEVFAISD